MISKPQARRGPARQAVGLAIRTTNASEVDPATAQIPGLWGRFSAEQWAERLGKLGAFGPILAVYSKYESDASGSYQLLVGREFSGVAPDGDELATEMIPAGEYLVFSCAGPLPQAVIDGWRRVWSFFEQSHPPARAYTADVEVYSESQPVEIWVAIQR